MGYATGMDESATKLLLWWETCPHLTCSSKRFASPIRRDGHLVIRHDAFAGAGSNPGPLSDVGVCDDVLCECSGQT